MFLCVLFIFGWQVAFCEEGYLGYEGGISAYKDPDPKKTKIEYYEYTFITGKPIFLFGYCGCKDKKGSK